MLVTVLAILVSNIHYLFTLSLDTNIQNISPTSTNRHQLYVANITLSSTSLSGYFRYSLFFLKMNVIFYSSVSIRPKSCVTKLNRLRNDQWEARTLSRDKMQQSRLSQMSFFKGSFDFYPFNAF